MEPTIDDVKARLAARGLIAGPRVVIPKEPRGTDHETPRSETQPHASAPSLPIEFEPTFVMRRTPPAPAAPASQPPGRGRSGRAFVVLAVALTLVLGCVLVGTRADSPTPTGDEAACTHFESIRADIAAGALAPRELDAELRTLVDRSADAQPSVQGAVRDLAGADGQTSDAFLVARTKLAAACAAGGNTAPSPQ